MKLLECVSGFRVPRFLREALRCPRVGCRGRLLVNHRATLSAPVVLRCLACGVHFELRNPSILRP